MKRYLYIYITALAFITGCRTDETINPIEETETGTLVAQTELAGMYVLCEGNMGSNKCTLDYLEFSTGLYQRNIYATVNPDVVMELGDVGNDIQIYGSQLWMVINCSNKVEVCRASNAKRIGQVEVPNCRYVVFNGGYAYVSSYVGPVTMGEQVPRGSIYKIDTLTLQTAATVTVGYQPEEMAIINGKLYVANSGGYCAPDYDNTVSVIDLETFTEEYKIKVDINLHHCRSDRYGNLWVTSRGDYYNNYPKLFCLKKDSSGQIEVIDTLKVPVTDLCIVGDSLYYLGTGYNNFTQQNDREMGIINIRTHSVVSSTLSTAPEIDAIEMPYGIIVNPVDRDFYLMDAKNYVSSGQLLHFKADGTFDFKVNTGDIPAHAVFLEKK